jgi:shikimate kinase
VSLAQAWERVAGAVAGRPMLDPARPRESLARLLQDRAPAYERADISVESGSAAPEDVAGLVLELLRIRAGHGSNT